MPLEDNYLIPSDSPLQQPSSFILSGCSGGGKSTILAELARQGFQCIAEPGRQIVKEQTAIGGDALPWINLAKFLDLTLSRAIFHYLTQLSSPSLTFYDRSIVDTIPHSTSPKQKTPQHFLAAAQKFKYGPLVFLVPPWPEIFKNDSERKSTFTEATREYEHLLDLFPTLGYQVLIIPKAPNKERVAFILDAINKAHLKKTP